MLTLLPYSRFYLTAARCTRWQRLLCTLTGAVVVGVLFLAFYLPLVWRQRALQLLIAKQKRAHSQLEARLNEAKESADLLAKPPGYVRHSLFPENLYQLIAAVQKSGALLVKMSPAPQAKKAKYHFLLQGSFEQLLSFFEQGLALLPTVRVNKVRLKKGAAHFVVAELSLRFIESAQDDA